MTLFYPPSQTITASVIGGVLVSTFDAVPYKRRLLSLVVTASVTTAVEVYVGIVNPAAMVETNRIGSNNTYNPVSPVVVPAGYPMYVRWPSTTGVDTANAAARFEGET